jgi:hypothetical protein
MFSIRNIAAAATTLVAAACFAQGTTIETTSSSSAAIKELQPQNVRNGLSVSSSVTTYIQPQLAGGGTGTTAARAQVTFPPTPPPRATVVPMTEAQVDDHILPRNILSQTSDVIAISYNGFRRSQLDPCGCVSHQLGGLDKEARVVKRLQELNVPLVITDAGGYVRDNPTDSDMSRSKILLEALHALGANVVNVGYSDLSGGADKLKSAAEAAKVELISANVNDGSGNLMFKPFSVQTVKAKEGDVKVAFVGVTRPRIPVVRKKSTSATQDMTTPTPAPAQPGSYTVTDMIDALQKYVPEARKQADLVVALVYDRRDKTSEMLKELGEAKPDIAISGEYLQPQANVLDINGTKLVSAGYEGRQTGLLVVSVKDKKVAAASNQFIEIVQSLPDVADITKYVTEAKSLTLAPTAPPAVAGAKPAQLGLDKDDKDDKESKDGKDAKGKDAKSAGTSDKAKPAKLDLNK